MPWYDAPIGRPDRGPLDRHRRNGYRGGWGDRVFVLGHVSFEVASRSVDTAALGQQQYFDSLLASGDFPELSRMAAEARSAIATEDEFERGLAWLLDGVAASIES
jgi:hypothetical protein